MGVSKLHREIAALENRAAALRKIAEVAEELGADGLSEITALLFDGGQLESSKQPALRGREALRAIIRETPGIWTLEALRAEMKRRGWYTSDKGVEAAAARLCRSREGRRVGKGRYVFPADYGREDSVGGNPRHFLMATA